jgi:hypothetical protein
MSVFVDRDHELQIIDDSFKVLKSMGSEGLVKHYYLKRSKNVVMLKTFHVSGSI